MEITLEKISDRMQSWIASRSSNQWDDAQLEAGMCYRIPYDVHLMKDLIIEGTGESISVALYDNPTKEHK